MTVTTVREVLSCLGSDEHDAIKETKEDKAAFMNAWLAALEDFSLQIQVQAAFGKFPNRSMFGNSRTCRRLVRVHELMRGKHVE